MTAEIGDFGMDAARRLHRDLIHSLGGFSFELAGGSLVTHERIPVPSFNFVDGAKVSVRRQTAFFEKALDHYFQRALRPSFRVDPDVPGHVDRTLRHFGFLPAPDPLVFLVAPTRGAPSSAGSVEVEEVSPDRAREIAAFWTHERERDEFERALDVVANHPNPGERLVPLLARSGTRTAAAALLYRRGTHAEVDAVATLPELRGRGIATTLVEGALASAARDGATTLSVLSTTPRLSARLAPLGFSELGRLIEYRLPANAELSLPPPGPPTPPRWRPPRAATLGR
jgi:ribosomal protein S18 acetylase RimI-like enzyme